MSLLVIICLLASASNPVFALDAGKALILNSDASIEKYFMAESEYKSQFTGRIIEIDLGRAGIYKSDIEDIILDENPDLIYCIGFRACKLAHQFAGDDIKIIFSSIINWRRLKSGQNTYGISNELHVGMQLMMFRYLFPEIKNFGILYSKTYSSEWLKDAVKKAEEMEIKITAEQVNKPTDLGPALKKILPEIDALWLIADPVVLSKTESVDEIFGQSNIMKKPVFAYNKAFAKYGALVILSADIPTMGGQAAGLANELLGDKKITKKVQKPAGSYCALNLNKVKEYGIDLNEEALDSVNRIIK